MDGFYKKISQARVIKYIVLYLSHISIENFIFFIYLINLEIISFMPR